jgi:hypothetical protein
VSIFFSHYFFFQYPYAFFLLQANKELVLSPGRETIAHVDVKQKRKESDDSLRRSVAYKRRKVELKQQKQSKLTTVEMREGICYQTAIDVTGCSAESTEEIPPPLQPVVQNPLPAIVQQILAQIGHNCSFRDKSMKFGTDNHEDLFQ